MEGNLDLSTSSNPTSKQHKLIDFVINNNRVGNRTKRLGEEDDEPKLHASELYAYLQQLDTNDLMDTTEWSSFTASPFDDDSSKVAMSNPSGRIGNILEKLSNSPLSKGNKRKLYDEIQPQKPVEIPAPNGITKPFISMAQQGVNLKNPSSDSTSVPNSHHPIQEKVGASVGVLGLPTKQSLSNPKIPLANKLPSLTAPREKIILPTVLFLNEKENSENTLRAFNPSKESAKSIHNSLVFNARPNPKIEITRLLKKTNTGDNKKLDDIKVLLEKHNAKVRPRM